MYKSKYISKIKGGCEETNKRESYVDVCFDFWNEIAPKDRKIVGKRIDNFLKRIKIAEGSEYSLSIPNEYINSLFAYSGYANKKIIGLGFSFNISSEGSLEDKIDFNAIDRFILTGKEPANKNN